ncbi:hypothetical protein [Alkalicoccus luteus]|uniref:Uncharacterized protein n=1 Tax=Alkalicoccus luteus TaxID=1237094 RepID=A0A969PNN6_9BACI|nr:hypothetical protein [Alkalicoccus luteus]NJP37541.1 hypothetical protein [Alkalicoccus luteus]
MSGDTYHKEHISAVLSQAEWFGTNVNITVNSDTFYLLPFDYTFLFIMHYGGIVFAILTCIFLLLLAWKFIWNTKAINHQPSKLLSYGVSILLIYPVLWNLFASLGLVNAVFLPMPFLTPASTMQLYYATLFGILVSLHRRRFTIFCDKKSKRASENKSIL